MRVELGGGTLVQNGWCNLDPVHGRGDWKRRAQDIPWPADDGAVDRIRASHILEHIPAGMEDRVAVMNECHRVLCSGGELQIIVPCVMVNGQPVKGWWPWADPTHVSYWCWPESFQYFDGTLNPNADYGIREWKMGASHVDGGWEAHVTMIKP